MEVVNLFSKTNGIFLEEKIPWLDKLNPPTSMILEQFPCLYISFLQWKMSFLKEGLFLASEEPALTRTAQLAQHRQANTDRSLVSAY